MGGHSSYSFFSHSQCVDHECTTASICAFLLVAVLHRPWASCDPPVALNRVQVVSELLPVKMHFPQVIHYIPR